MSRFSSRLPDELAPNKLSRAVAQLRADGESWFDLTESNPTAVGLSYPAGLLETLVHPRALRYAPQSLGLMETRECVAADYARRGVLVPPDRIVLTASTSEAYGFLFKLLCNPADEVLVPQPSYPLFDLLTQLEGVAARPYRLDDDGAWWVDRDSVLAALSSRTRAILVVSPNNPTGSLLRADDRRWLEEMCETRGVSLIGDEVFADYRLSPRPDGCPVIGDSPALTFSLGGLSKSAGLPQVKLGWIAVDGPAPAVADALQRLELIADTYLSVSTPVQLAAPRLIELGASVRAAIMDRLRGNLEQLRARLPARSAVSLLEPEGGWSAVLRVPAVLSEEALVLRLLADARVLVHPGYFFDFPSEAFLVVSLLPEPSAFSNAIDRLVPLAEGGAA
jgi:aspartate/methionine/tyrosine aminotransferase